MTPNTFTLDARTRLKINQENFQSYLKRQLPETHEQQNVIIDAAATTTKLNDITDASKLCAELRGSALRAQQHFPAIAAFMDEMANDLQTLQKERITQ